MHGACDGGAHRGACQAGLLTQHSLLLMSRDYGMRGVPGHVRGKRPCAGQCASARWVTVSSLCPVWFLCGCGLWLFTFSTENNYVEHRPECCPRGARTLCVFDSRTSHSVASSDSHKGRRATQKAAPTRRTPKGGAGATPRQPDAKARRGGGRWPTEGPPLPPQKCDPAPPEIGRGSKRAHTHHAGKSNRLM